MSSGLFASLYNNTNAMRAHSAALDIVGRNMANVNNTAYARQRIVYGDRGSVNTPLGAQSLGVEPVGIQQMRDRILDGQIAQEISNTSSFEAQQRFLEQAQTALGQGLFGQPGQVDTIDTNPTLPAGISAALDAFFNAWDNFAANPADSVGRQQLLAATDSLVSRIHVADSRLADISLPATTSNTLTDQMDTDVDTVNGLLTTIADLNRQIGRVEVIRPGSAVDLRDQRQAKLEELAKYIDFTPVQQADGQVAIQVRDTANNPVNLVDLSVVQGSLLRNGSNYEWTPTTGPAVNLDFNGGSLAGYQASGAAVQGYRTQLDTFVGNLVTQVNTAYNSATNGDFFAAGGTTAATISVTATTATLRAADAASGAGANDRALAVAALARDSSFMSGTPAQAFARIVTGVAQDLNTVESRMEDQQALGDFLKAQRDSYGGVSLDEEVADMMRLQRAFQASARMMNVMNDLLAQVIQTLGN